MKLYLQLMKIAYSYEPNFFTFFGSFSYTIGKVIKPKEDIIFWLNLSILWAVHSNINPYPVLSIIFALETERGSSKKCVYKQNSILENIYLFKIRCRNTRGSCDIYLKLRVLNMFHTFFWNLYRCLWAIICLLGQAM